MNYCYHFVQSPSQLFNYNLKQIIASIREFKIQLNIILAIINIHFIF